MSQHDIAMVYLARNRNLRGLSPDSSDDDEDYSDMDKQDVCMSKKFCESYAKDEKRGIK